MKTLILFFMLCLGFGCASSPSESPAKMSQLQLQEQMQRFYTRFTERLVESLTATLVRLQDAKLSETSYRQYLLYDSEALKIVTGPYPEINLLDMLVFVKLSKIAVNEYWVPQVYHESGKGLLKAFDDSEEDIEKVAEQLITKEQVAKVDALVMAWRKDHPNERRVEKIRLAEFSQFIKKSKESGESDAGFALSQLLVDTQSATAAVDDMVLVANRGIFLVQQMPFIVRLHSRILAMEMVDDFSLRFGLNASGGNPFKQAQEDANPGVITKMEFLVDSAYEAIQLLKSSPDFSSVARQKMYELVWILGGIFMLLVFLASLIFWGMAWIFQSRLAKRT